MILTFTSLILLSLNSVDDEIPNVKEFPEYSCKLTLPGPEFKWANKTLPPELLAGFYDESGTDLTLSVQSIAKNVKIDEFFIRDLQESYLNDDSVALISGKMTTFQNVPSYQIRFRSLENDAIKTTRFIIANGYLYGLHLELQEGQITEDGRRNKIFDAFEFIGDPQLPRSSYRSPNLRPKGKRNKTIRRLVKFFIGIVGVIFAIGLWYRHRNLQQDDF